jgi:pimeloyl-ACP methyl ester carboxylesterase
MSANTYVPIGKLVDVDGHLLHIYPTGEGGPTVVFEGGGGHWSLDWYLVQTEVAKFTCACSYDRAGFGWSDPGVKPRTSGQMVKELHALLGHAAVPKPYVLVGASFGGHAVRLYARNYAEEVGGIVLLDARHESLDAKMPPAWKKLENAGKGTYRFLLLASRLRLLNTLVKLMGKKAALPPMATKLPPEMVPMYLEVGYPPKYWETCLDELAAVAESDQQVIAAGSLGNMPLVVIRHAIPDLFASLPAEQAQQAEQVWQGLQVELAQQSSNSRLLVAEKSGHGIHIEQPELVVDMIRQMVEVVRRAPSVE